MRRKEGFIRQGAKIIADSPEASRPDWHEWLRLGCLCRIRKEFCLLRDQTNDWEGKQALLTASSAAYMGRYMQQYRNWVIEYPYVTDPDTGLEVPTLAVYLGELGRRTIKLPGSNVSTRAAVHLFLLPSGSYIVPPGAFEPYSKEETQNGDVEV